jgi:hypothetical protein
LPTNIQQYTYKAELGNDNKENNGTQPSTANNNERQPTHDNQQPSIKDDKQWRPTIITNTHTKANKNINIKQKLYIILFSLTKAA